MSFPSPIWSSCQELSRVREESWHYVGFISFILGLKIVLLLIYGRQIVIHSLLIWKEATGEQGGITRYSDSVGQIEDPGRQGQPVGACVHFKYSNIATRALATQTQDYKLMVTGTVRGFPCGIVGALYRATNWEQWVVNIRNQVMTAFQNSGHMWSVPPMTL